MEMEKERERENERFSFIIFNKALTKCMYEDLLNRNYN